MTTKPRTSVHAEAHIHRKLILFAAQLEGYLAHFPNCHKYTLTQCIRQAYLDVYNLTTEAQKRYHKKTTLTQLDVRHEQLRMMIHLAHELGLFGYSAGRKDAENPGDHRCANFVGFRTWASGRFIRPHVIGALRTDARRGRLAGVISRLGHARRTCSFQPLMTHLEDRHHDLYSQLPQSFHALHRHSNVTAQLDGSP